MVRVKICGITSVDDALAASDLGADAIGLIFAKSSRHVTLKNAVKISRLLGPWISVVGVFVDVPSQTIRRIADQAGFSAVQLHGHESAAESAKLAKTLRVIKAFHVDGGFDANAPKKYLAVSAFLFDSKIAGQMGGTGKVFDWKALNSASLKKPVIISGGLHPGNVAEAVRFFKPYGVDAASGTEKSPGKKDLKLVKAFIQNAKKVIF